MYKAKVTLTRAGDYAYNADEVKIPIEVVKKVGKDDKMRMGLWIKPAQLQKLRKNKKEDNITHLKFEIEGWDDENFAFGGDL